MLTQEWTRYASQANDVIPLADFAFLKIGELYDVIFPTLSVYREIWVKLKLLREFSFNCLYFLTDKSSIATKLPA